MWMLSRLFVCEICGNGAIVACYGSDWTGSPKYHCLDHIGGKDE